MLGYLRRVISHGSEESSKRFSLVVATLTFAVCNVLVAIGAMLGRNGAPEAAWAFSIALAGMAGYSYTRGVAAEAAGAPKGRVPGTTLAGTPSNSSPADSQP